MEVIFILVMVGIFAYLMYLLWESFEDEREREKEYERALEDSREKMREWRRKTDEEFVRSLEIMKATPPVKTTVGYKNTETKTYPSKEKKSESTYVPVVFPTSSRSSSPSSSDSSSSSSSSYGSSDSSSSSSSSYDSGGGSSGGGGNSGGW